MTISIQGASEDIVFPKYEDGWGRAINRFIYIFGLNRRGSKIPLKILKQCFSLIIVTKLVYLSICDLL